jgi:predicted nucleotidyltransferase
VSVLTNHIADISKICAVYGVKHLYIFGSSLTENFNTASDIDLLVDFLPIADSEYADNYYGLKFSLENILNRKVDLLEEPAIKNPYFLEAIQNKKQLLYGN